MQKAFPCHDVILLLNNVITCQRVSWFCVVWRIDNQIWQLLKNHRFGDNIRCCDRNWKQFAVGIIWVKHDDVIKWQHFPRYWPFVRGIHGSPVNSPHKGQWRGALMFSLICTWIKGWINNREAGDLRRHRAHYDYDVIVMNHRRLRISALQFIEYGHNDHLRYFKGRSKFPFRIQTFATKKVPASATYWDSLAII